MARGRYGGDRHPHVGAAGISPGKSKPDTELDRRLRENIDDVFSTPLAELPGSRSRPSTDEEPAAAVLTL